MMADGWWKDAIEIADDLRRVANGILREEHAIESVLLEAGAQRSFIEGAVESQQAADTGEVEAETERNGFEAFDKDEDDERKALTTAGQTSIE